MNWLLLIAVWVGLAGWFLAFWFGTRITYWHEMWEEEYALSQALTKARDRGAVDEAENYTKEAA